MQYQFPVKQNCIFESSEFLGRLKWKSQRENYLKYLVKFKKEFKRRLKDVEEQSRKNSLKQESNFNSNEVFEKRESGK